MRLSWPDGRLWAFPPGFFSEGSDTAKLSSPDLLIGRHDPLAPHDVLARLNDEQKQLREIKSTVDLALRTTNEDLRADLWRAVATGLEKHLERNNHTVRTLQGGIASLPRDEDLSARTDEEQVAVEWAALCADCEASFTTTTGAPGSRAGQTTEVPSATSHKKSLKMHLECILGHEDTAWFSFPEWLSQANVQSRWARSRKLQRALFEEPALRDVFDAPGRSSVLGYKNPYSSAPHNVEFRGKKLLLRTLSAPCRVISQERIRGSSARSPHEDADHERTASAAHQYLGWRSVTIPAGVYERGQTTTPVDFVFLLLGEEVLLKSFAGRMGSHREQHNYILDEHSCC